MYSEAKHISYAVSFLCMLLWFLSFMDFAQPIMLSLGWQNSTFLNGQLGVTWPYFSMIFALLLLLLGLRFPTRKEGLRSAFALALLSFALIFESFGLFVEHPYYSFVSIWNYLVEMLLGLATAASNIAPANAVDFVSLATQDFLPLTIFGFWGPALALLILPMQRFPLLHWIFCFNLLFFSIIHITAVIFLQLYAAGFVFSLLCLVAIFHHMRLLSKKTYALETFNLCVVSFFYSLLLFLLALIPSTGLFFQSLFPKQYNPLYLSLAKDFLEVKLLTYVIFFLWFSFPLLFLLLFPSHKDEL